MGCELHCYYYGNSGLLRVTDLGAGASCLGVWSGCPWVATPVDPLYAPLSRQHGRKLVVYFRLGTSRCALWRPLCMRIPSRSAHKVLLYGADHRRLASQPSNAWMISMKHSIGGGTPGGFRGPQPATVKVGESHNNNNSASASSSVSGSALQASRMRPRGPRMRPQGPLSAVEFVSKPSHAWSFSISYERCLSRLASLRIRWAAHQSALRDARSRRSACFKALAALLMETLSRHGDPLHPGLVFPVGSVDSLVAANGASIAPARRARREPLMRRAT